VYLNSKNDYDTYRMAASNLFQITDILACNLFNTCILALDLHFSNTINSDYISSVKYLPEDDHRRPKHVGGVSYFKNYCFLILCGCWCKYCDLVYWAEIWSL